VRLLVARKSQRSRRTARKRAKQLAKSSAAEAARSAVAERAELSWRVLPCARDWRLTTATVVLLFLILCVVYLAFGHVGWLALSALLLIGSLSSFFLPTTYTLSNNSVTVKRPFGTTRRDWMALRSHRVDARGVLLSPFSHPSRLEGFRGIYLQFQDNREQVMAIVSTKTGSDRGK